MAFTKSGLKALNSYLAKTQASGVVEKFTIKGAVQLTEQKRAEIEEILVTLWKRPSYACPLVLDLKPHHGYSSRVIKDQFHATQYGIWIEQGCSDLANVTADGDGRPRLTLGPLLDYPNYQYTLVVPIRSDWHGTVHIDDVIPLGLPKGAKKT